MRKSTEDKLVAPCGINCGGCIAYFGYTMSGKESILVMVVGRDQDFVLLSKRNVRSWQKQNFDIVLNVVIFLVKCYRFLIPDIGKGMVSVWWRI